MKPQLLLCKWLSDYRKNNFIIHYQHQLQQQLINVITSYSSEIFNPGNNAHCLLSSLRLSLRTWIHCTVKPAVNTSYIVWDMNKLKTKGSRSCALDY